MTAKFKTLFFVKSSLIFLYLALTIPIPFISIERLKILSIIVFIFGFFLIINVTSDYVETNDEKVSYESSFLAKLFGRKSWEIFWQDIKLIKSLPTSQGSKVHYIITKKKKSFLLPQRIEDLNRFLSIISEKTGLNIDGISYISPLWTYKLLTLISLLMIIGEIIAFLN